MTAAVSVFGGAFSFFGGFGTVVGGGLGADDCVMPSPEASGGCTSPLTSGTEIWRSGSAAPAEGVCDGRSATCTCGACVVTSVAAARGSAGLDPSFQNARPAPMTTTAAIPMKRPSFDLGASTTVVPWARAVASGRPPAAMVGARVAAAVRACGEPGTGIIVVGV